MHTRNASGMVCAAAAPLHMPMQRRAQTGRARGQPGFQRAAPGSDLALERDGSRRWCIRLRKTKSDGGACFSTVTQFTHMTVGSDNNWALSPAHMQIPARFRQQSRHTRALIASSEYLGAVWFRGYPLGDEDIPNHLVRDSYFCCLVQCKGRAKFLFG
jgi:hypothetical protein